MTKCCVFPASCLPPGQKKTFSKCSRGGRLQTKPVCIFGCPVHIMLWMKDIPALSGRKGLFSEPGGWRGTGY